MFIIDFSADVSTINFGTVKDTQTVHDTLHTKGIKTISELCHLSKKHIEALELDPSLIELHLKKNGLSIGMSDNDILQHKRIVQELLKKNDGVPSTNKSSDDIQVKRIITSFYKADMDWSERHYELAKSLYLADHCIFRSKKNKTKRAFILANDFIAKYLSLCAVSLECLAKE